MPRTQVYPTDILQAIKMALDGTQLNQGTLRVVIDGQTLRIYSNSDAGTGGTTNNWNLQLH